MAGKGFRRTGRERKKERTYAARLRKKALLPRNNCGEQPTIRGRKENKEKRCMASPGADLFSGLMRKEGSKERK